MEEELRREFQLHRQHHEEVMAYNEKRNFEIQQPSIDSKNLLHHAIPLLDNVTRGVQKKRNNALEQTESTVMRAFEDEAKKLHTLKTWVLWNDYEKMK